MSFIILGFLLAAAICSLALGVVAFTPADFDHLEVDRGVLVTDVLGGGK